MTIRNEYPIGISQNPHRSFMLFVNEIDVIEDVKTASPEAAKKIADKDRVAKEVTVWGCALALPNDMTDSQTHNWGTSESVVSKGIGTLIDSASSIGLGKAGGALAGSKNKLASSAGRGISNNSSFSVASVVKEVSHRMGNRQPIVNPMYWQDYKGTDPRSFNFQWDLIPNSKEESDQILEILRKLKQYTSPKLTALELGLLSPYTFDITIANGHIDNIMKLKNVAVRSLNINYVADGAVQFHHDGTPKHYTLSMQVVELRASTSEDFDGSEGPADRIDAGLKYLNKAGHKGIDSAKEFFGGIF